MLIVKFNLAVDWKFKKFMNLVTTFENHKSRESQIASSIDFACGLCGTSSFIMVLNHYEILKPILLINAHLSSFNQLKKRHFYFSNFSYIVIFIIKNFTVRKIIYKF